MLEKRRPTPLIEVRANMTLTLPSRLVLSTRRMCWKLLSFIMSDIFAASQSFRRPRSGDAARLVASGQGARAGGHRDGAPGSLSFISRLCYSKNERLRTASASRPPSRRTGCRAAAPTHAASSVASEPSCWPFAPSARRPSTAYGHSRARAPQAACPHCDCLGFQATRHQ